MQNPRQSSKFLPLRLWSLVLSYVINTVHAPLRFIRATKHGCLHKQRRTVRNPENCLRFCM
ncbi:hypothetical protein GALMADRAFT_241822 [Galerina marginata CBS 339.88]|uniref:Uncharacterized protein n=1 Tax=Galerina marginata (strain CBS 339.88) TaxID=685588 RepID=A0A067TG33_GALM3|nr:hypothetical protein GALMADRAFT_241822 [Galerina marginata CBS 339.88]